MKDFQFEFDFESFNQLFPFYLLIDDNLNIVRFGESILKLMPHLNEKKPFKEVFTFKRPGDEILDFTSFRDLFSQLIVIESVQGNPVVLRGQFQQHKEYVLFVGSPWFTSMDKFKEQNLRLNDFAIHDPLVDLLYLLKNQENHNDDLKELIVKIKDQKQILIQDKEEIKTLSLVASANKSGVVLTDLQGKLFWTNEAYLELTGYTNDAVINKNLFDLVVSNLTNLEDLQKMRSSFIQGNLFDFDVSHKKSNGMSFFSRMKGQPVLDSCGNVVQYFVIIEDITKEKKISDQLIESENRLASLVVNLQSGILLEDEQRKILLVNKKFCEMFNINMEPELMIGFDCSNSAEQVKELFKDKEGFLKRIEQILNNKTITSQEALELVDGRSYERSYMPIIIDGVFRGNLWSYDDITLKKKYDKSLTLEKEKYRSIIDNMNIGLLEVDNNDRILLANQRFSNMSGYSVDFLLGKKGAEIFLDEEENEKIKSKQLNRSMGISDSYEIEVKNKNGDKRVWLVSGAPNYNLNGEVIGSIGLHFDITEIKKLENQKQSLIRKLEKQNEQLLDYAQIVSHDLKSPLRSIHSLITFIKEDTNVAFNEKTIKYFNLIQEKTEKMDFLIQGILDYSKIENIEVFKEQIDLDDLVDSIRQIIFVPSHISIIIKNELPTVTNDLFRMQQLFQNLISNAVNYNDKPQGYVEISSEEYHDHYVFAVKDNGIGIEKKNQKKIFEMFQSFNSDYKSTGIGLSIVRRILKNENEKIWIESQKDVGTTFFFTLHK